MTDPLALVVGCEFDLDTSQPVAAVMQVAPSPQAEVRMDRERRDTDAVPAATSTATAIAASAWRFRRADPMSRTRQS